jgi:hypothetical protein
MQNTSSFNKDQIDSFDNVVSKSVVRAEHANLMASAVMQAQTKASGGLMFTDKDVGYGAGFVKGKRVVLCGHAWKQLPTAGVTNHTHRIDVAIADDKGNVVKGAWSDPRWAIYVDVVLLNPGFIEVPKSADDILPGSNLYTATPAKFSIVDYDSTYTTARIYVKSTALKQSALVTWTAVSEADEITSSYHARSPYSDGGYLDPGEQDTGNDGSGIVGDGTGIPDDDSPGFVNETRLTKNLIRNSDFYTGSTDWDIKPSVYDVPGSANKEKLAYMLATRRTPQHGLDKNSSAYTFDWTDYRWSDLITPIEGAGPKYIGDSWDYMQDGRGASTAIEFKTIGGSNLTISSPYHVGVLEFEWALGAAHIDELTKHGQDNFFGYVHMYWFSNSWEQLGVSRFRLEDEIKYDLGDKDKRSWITKFKYIHRVPLHKSVIEVKPPIGARHCVLGLMCMVDDPLGPMSEDYALIVDNIVFSIWHKELID